MADRYCDLDLATGLNDGTSAADAWQSASDLFSGAAAGDRVLVQGTEDTAGTKTFTSAGTEAAPLELYGIKSTSTLDWATIADSDLAVPGVDTMPGWAPTSSVDDMNFNGGQTLANNLKFLCQDNTTINGYWEFVNCDQKGLDWTACTDNTKMFRMRGGRWETDASSYFQMQNGIHVEFLDVTFTGTFPNNIFDIAMESPLQVRGCDLTGAASKTLVDAAACKQGKAKFINNEMPTTYTVSSGTFVDHESSVEIIQSDDSSALGSSNSVIYYVKESFCGDVASDVTHVRTGGADDGKTGAFAWALTATTNCQGPYYGVESPWMTGIIEGAGTSKTVTVYIANDTASTDFTSDDAHLEIEYPDEAGTSMYSIAKDDDFSQIATATTLGDDTGSTWGTGANNHQKLVATIAPDYWGPFRCRVVFTRSGTDTLYVDPLPVVT